MRFFRKPSTRQLVEQAICLLREVQHSQEKIMSNLDRLTADLAAQTTLINDTLVPQLQKNGTDINTAIDLIKAGNNDAALGVLADAAEANNAALTSAGAEVAADDANLEAQEPAPPAKPAS